MSQLTKVRPPVSAISTLENGTTTLDIATTGDDIVATVSGSHIVDITTTGIDVVAGKILTADDIVGEQIDLDTSAGAAATIKTTGTKLQVGTTSAHIMELLANAIAGLTIATDGKVTLGVQGTSGSHLVNKTYVDTVAASTSSTPATIATTGSISFPNSTGDALIIKWGTTAASAQLTQVTFAVAFPNSIFIALCSPTQNRNAASDGLTGVYDKQLTGFKINAAQTYGAHDVYNWVAFGY